MATKSTPIKPDDSPFRTSTSVIARYFFQDCERFLRYSASSTAQRKRHDLPLKEFDHSPLMKAIFESGYDWERAVLETHLKGKAKVAAGNPKANHRVEWPDLCLGVLPYGWFRQVISPRSHQFMRPVRQLTGPCRFH